MNLRDTYRRLDPQVIQGSPSQSFKPDWTPSDEQEFLEWYRQRRLLTDPDLPDRGEYDYRAIYADNGETELMGGFNTPNWQRWPDKYRRTLYR